MMVKKKRHGEEDAGEEKYIETSDNKENNNYPDYSGMLSNEDDSAENDLGNPEELSSSETGSSDKVVTRERELEEKLAEMQDKYLRLSAEFDNYRKRTLREKMELSKYASEDMLLKLLPVMDDFDRAVSNIESSSDYIAMKNGIDLIYVKFNDFLKQNGVREIDSLNCPFDVDLHDAVAKLAVEEEDKKGKIIDVIQKGYYLQDKVIRHSKVVVGE
jgi:molecular chaperone GrpE